ncbi:MAG: ATP-binding protein, partial [Halodesulfurarchaeum sp.]
MSHVLGRKAEAGPTASLGSFLARDGSHGARVALDLDRPHVSLLAGKRGSGKSYTLGVLAEGIAAARGVTGVLVDPMGVFDGLAEGAHATVIDAPTVAADALEPRDWCALLELDPTGAPGALLWQVAEGADTLGEMIDAVEGADAPRSVIQAVSNHLSLAAQWEVFHPDGLDAERLFGPATTVIDATRLSDQALGVVTAAVARTLYETAVAESIPRLPWLMIDEAQAVVDGIAGPPLRTILTRGRHPGVSLVLATQRPAALPSVAISQSDLLLSHRLTATADIDALAAARPTYIDETIQERLPDGVGEAVVVDDTTEAAVTVQVRERLTPHGGDSPRA